ncbi:MAG: Grx4 family monothiol glutaredoxin [Synechococcaceae cyanobacterium SM2_3_1]|nr:Grx4 family monothiol glutaredoxin [Synechococcaceae cyanobacterium SM2_3_1]
MDPLLQDKIQDQIRSSSILIYMKGTPAMPMCGFSNAVVRTFDTLGARYDTVNVLDDPEIREGIKDFSDWRTIPQVYINGEFVGGCDIILEMHQRGELAPLVQSAMEGSPA